MTSNRKDGLQRAARTFLQMLAAGVFLEVTQQLAGDIGAPWSAYILAFYTIAVSYAQNELEAMGVIRPILKPTREGETNAGA